MALAVAPLAGVRGATPIDSKFHGVQIGAITYSFNSIANSDPEAIIRAYVEIGLGEAELRPVLGRAPAPRGIDTGRFRQAHHPVTADPADQLDGQVPQHPGQTGDVVAGIHDDRDVRVSGLPLAGP